jgi:hypothetical protein
VTVASPGNLVAMAGTRDDPEQAPADLGPRIAEIYGGSLAEFVARREALARELRGAGRRDEAAEIKALRKPKALAWALDAGALADPDATAELAAAVDGMNDAQGGDGDVRAAIARLRAAEEAMVAAAHDAARTHDNPVDRTAVAAALRAVVGSPAALSALLAGRLIDPVAADEGDGDGDTGTIDEAAWSVPPPKRSSRRSAGTATAGKGRSTARTADTAVEASAPPRADPAAVRAARRAVTAADRAATKAERAAERAASAADEAEAARSVAEDEAAAARRRADELADAAARARDDAAARASEREEAAAELARARAELEALEPHDD